MSQSPATQEHFLVIGGGGFLGRHIIDALKARGEKNITCLDLRQSFEDKDLTFITGDITNVEQMNAALAGVDVCIHTASPMHGCPEFVYQKVNVDGTKVVLDACAKNGVKKLVYTSSAGTVFNGADLKGVNETIPYPDKPLDGYTRTKAEAEKMVLDFNGTEGVLTVALRPSGIFGPRDRQMWVGFAETGAKGKSKFMIGDGSNLMDWTYVGNISHAHLLASDQLVPGASCAGEPYFITNGEPMPFWDMGRYVYRDCGYPEPSIAIPFKVALVLAHFLEFIAWIISPLVTFHPTFTHFRCVNAGAHRYFDISKARADLGYAPVTSLEDAMKITGDAFDHLRVGPLLKKNNKKKED